MMIEKDYKQFDFQTIVLKKDVADEIISNYECFGWTVERKKQHQRYENLIEVEMSRSHFVDNKDGLQYLQVNMESDIIKRGRLKKLKHSKSTGLGMTFALISFALILCCVLMLVKTFIINSIAIACVLGILGVGIGILIPNVCGRIYKKENEIYAEKEKYFSDEIKNYTLIAKELLGAKDGE